MKEIWKDVVDFEGIYEISNFGNFRRNPLKSRKAKYPKLLNRLGYEYIGISKDGKRTNKTVHQMVAAAFIPNFKYGMHVNHINGIKHDNTLTNLELSNHVHNNTHAHTLPTAYKPGKSKYFNVSIRKDKRNKNPRFDYVASIKINSIRHYIGTFLTEIEAAKAVDNYLDKIGDTLRIRNFP
jgi:hypothetical protein